MKNICVLALNLENEDGTLGNEDVSFAYLQLKWFNFNPDMDK